jgi:hypothetical protein
MGTKMDMMKDRMWEEEGKGEKKGKGTRKPLSERYGCQQRENGQHKTKT